MPRVVVGTYRDRRPSRLPLTRLGGGADRVALSGLDDVGRRRAAGRAPGRRARRRLATEVLGSPAATRSSSSSSDVCWRRRRTRSGPAAAHRGPRPPPAAPGRARVPTTAPCWRPRRCRAARSPPPTWKRHLGGGGCSAPGDPVTRPAAIDAALARAAGLRIVERAAGTGTWAFVHDLFRHGRPRGADRRGR